jgi:hypothetical protein
LKRDGALIVREFLNSHDLRCITDTLEAAFAYLHAGGGDEGMRHTWKQVGTIWLPNLGRCGVGSDLAREFSALLSQHADRLLGRYYLAADICSIRRINEKHVRLEWHTDCDAAAPDATTRASIECRVGQNLVQHFDLLLQQLHAQIGHAR